MKEGLFYMNGKILEVKNLTVSFKKQTIFQNINFSIDKKQVVTILGNSGAGKTTLLKTLNGLVPNYRGDIYINNDLINLNDKNVKRNHAKRIGLVFQDFNLYPHLTVMENITLAPRLQKERPLDEIDSETNEWLMKLKLDNKKEQYPHQLSGGEKQRVAIIRALLLNPKILCFDEPTSALDPSLKSEVVKLIKQLGESITILIVTHDLEFAKEISDRIIYIEKGVITKDCEVSNYFPSY